MDIIIICILVAIFLAWLFYFRPINPSNKTDDQLQMMYRIAKSPRDIEALEAEMKKRGLIGSSNKRGLKDSSNKQGRGLLDGSGIPARAPSTELHLTQLNATTLRNSARNAYDEGWKMAKQKWNDDERKCHQHALTTVLLRRLQAESGAPAISEELMNALNFETIPFNALQPEQGKDAICEYIVWRENPSLANIGIILHAVNTLKKQGFVDKVLKDTDKKSLDFIPWAKLL